TVQMVEVPDVIGQTREQATNSMKGMGLDVKVEEEAGDDDTSVGEVIDQDPPARRSVAAGTTVTITINVGPEKATIPDGLVGMSENEAKKALTDAGFTNVSTEEADSEDPGTDKGTVLGVQPSSGNEVALGTEIVLEVATGAGRIPDFIAMDKTRAEQFAKEHGFAIEYTEKEVEGGNHTVIEQSPNDGETAKWGTTVKAVIGVPKAPETSSSPSDSPTDDPTDEPTDDPSDTPGGPS